MRSIDPSRAVRPSALDIFQSLNDAIARSALVPLLLRIALAVPLWQSGLLKWDGFLRLNDIAVTLFTDEFMLHLPGGPYPYPAPETMAFLAGSAEIVLPILLVTGFATRFAALGVLIMTAVIQVTVPGGWPVHISWAAMALALMTGGAGLLSVDYALRFAQRSPASRVG